MPCVKSGARAGSLYRNLVAHALTLGASGDRAPVRQQPCQYYCFSPKLYHDTKHQSKKQNLLLVVEKIWH